MSQKTKASKQIIVGAGSGANSTSYFIQDDENVRKETHFIKSGAKTQKPILAKPLELIDYYISENEELLYEVKINGKVRCETKVAFRRYLFDETLLVDTTSPHELRVCVNGLFRKIIENKKLKLKKLYPTVGVFLDAKRNFILSYPGIPGIKVYGENDAQRFTIDKIEKKQLDLKGTTGKYFFNLLKLKAVPDDVKFFTMGYTAIEAFFEALKDKLDIYPNFFWVHHLSSVGKSSFFELLGNNLYGTELLSKDNVGSISRLTMFLSSSTFPLVIDDLNKIKPELLDALKSPSTNRTPRMRLNKEQKLKVDRTLCSIMGTANSLEFLLGRLNQAFRDRSLIFTSGKPIEDDAKSRIWDINYHNIKTGKIFGAYFLQKSIEYIQNSGKGPTDFDRFLDIFNNALRDLKKEIKARLFKTLSRRRLEMYVLMYIGMKLWEYSFDSLNLNFQELKDFIDFKKDGFFEVIKEQESVQKVSSGAEFEQIISFYEQFILEPYSFSSKYGKRTFESLVDAHGIPVVRTDFVAAYDEWAKRKGYTTLGSLTQLAELESSLLQGENKDVRKKTILVRGPRELHGVTNLRVYGVHLHVERIKKVTQENPLINTNVSDSSEVKKKSKQKNINSVSLERKSKSWKDEGVKAK